MKTSNAIITALIAVIAAIIIVVVILIRSFVGSDVFEKTGVTITADADYDSEIFPIEGISRIVSDGPWQLEIRRGGTSSLEVYYPQNLRSIIEVDTDGDSLRLGLSRDVRVEHLDEIRAVMVLLDLGGLDTTGMATVTIEGFDGIDLKVSSDGVIDLKADDLVIDSLVLEVSGASNLDFSRAEVYEARLDLRGAGIALLNMTGGRLRGEMSGLTNITYTGEVESVDVETSGAARVTRGEE